MEKQAKPIAVLISDVHYSVQTLELSDKAMRMAINKANELKVPLVVAGDLHDTKANMRGECVNAMLETFDEFDWQQHSCWIMVGNHDKINEKSSDNALNFLDCMNDRVWVVNTPTKPAYSSFILVPYYHDVEELRAYLKIVPKGSTLIMHQGIEKSNSGDYIQDKSALKHEDVKDFRAISGHYHQRQDIKTGRPQKGAVGLWSYIGNPYTLNFAEANDPPKGFQILMDDGILEFVPTNLRKHVIIEHNLCTGESSWTSGPAFAMPSREDIIWAKIKGSKEQLSLITKEAWTREYGLPRDIRFDLIPTDLPTNLSINTQNMTQMEVLDSIIGSLSDTSEERKERLKELWKGMK